MRRSRRGHRALHGAITALGLAACAGAPTSEFRYALGARADVPTWAGACDARTLDGDAVEIRGRTLHAVREGAATMQCTRGRLRIVVEAPDRLEIHGPSELPRTGRAAFRLVALDRQGRSIDLGTDGPVRWEADEGVVLGGGCHDVTRWCAGPAEIRARAAPDLPSGTRALTARWGDLSATRDLVVR